MGVSRCLAQKTHSDYIYVLSTPLWEFLTRRLQRPQQPMLRRLSTPLWEFPVTSSKIADGAVTPALSTPLWEFHMGAVQVYGWLNDYEKTFYSLMGVSLTQLQEYLVLFKLLLSFYSLMGVSTYNLTSATYMIGLFVNFLLPYGSFQFICYIRII